MKQNYVWLDSTDFKELGGWALDSQFSRLMGSPYLLAIEQPGVPVDDAKIDFEWKGEKKARVWVRTKNWYFPYAPGVFKIKVNDVMSETMLGDSPTHEWFWHLAGDFDLEQGKATLSLCDQSGYFGRAAAVLVTDDMDFVPPRPVDEYKNLRAKLMGKDIETKTNYGTFDVVVCGAGPAGIPAAIAAARHGAKVLLISNRPVIGGNGSVEMGVSFDGASSRQPNAREGGIAEEIVRRFFRDEKHWGYVLEDLVAQEENITVLLNHFVCDAKTENDIIVSATAMNVLTNEKIEIFAKQFIESSGDGWLGYYAGAKFRVGREAKWQYNEEFAPETPDTCTMSGVVENSLKQMRLGGMIQETDHETTYEAPDWVPKFPAGKDYGRNLQWVGYHWWLETPNIYDDIYDAEMARDELFRIDLGHYNYVKNLWHEKERAKNYTFRWMPYFHAKRESRRFIGDYVLTQNDCMEGRDFLDTVSHTGWPIDIHHPKGIYSGKEGPFFSNTHVPMSKIPFRCLYSVNIKNLFITGRCESVSHIALGTCRVQNTIACAAQAAGTAAALCAKDGIMPREFGQTRIKELQQILLKDDQYIPGRINEDELDLARKSTVTASSEKSGEEFYFHIGVESEGRELNKQRATFFARNVSDNIESVWTKFTNKTDEEKTVKVHVRLQADPDGYETEEDTCVCEIVLPPNSTDWYEVKINVVTKLRYIWLWTEKCDGVWWHTYSPAALDHTCSERENENEIFRQERDTTHAVQLEKPVVGIANCSADNIINGYSRIQSLENYEWVSDPDQGLPQWIELKLDKQQQINSVYVTLDTDMTNPSMLQPFKVVPSSLVTAYNVEVHDGEKWIEVASVKDNWLRRHIHKFDAINATRVRINVTATGDNQTARIMEVRIYNE